MLTDKNVKMYSANFGSHRQDEMTAGSSSIRATHHTRQETSLPPFTADGPRELSTIGR